MRNRGNASTNVKIAVGAWPSAQAFCLALPTNPSPLRTA